MRRRPSSGLVFSAPRKSHFFASALAAFFFVLAPGLRAQDVVVNLDPGTTKVEFTLGATLHTVHGTFKLKSGQIRFDPATGKASGVITIDATSGNTDNTSRDKKMHDQILESAKFPEIVFTPTQVTGPSSDVLAGKGTAQLQIAGAFRLHGQDHEMIVPVAVEPASGGGQGSGSRIQAAAKFDIPYVKWGLKNPSTFVLRVSDTVNLEVHAAAQISRPAANR